MPPGRRSNRPLVIGLAAGMGLLVLLAAAIVVLVVSNSPSDHTIKGTLQLRQVLATTPSACSAGDAGRVSSVKADACYSLGEGMTITEVRNVRLIPPDPSRGTIGYTVEITLRPQDATRLATLTTKVAPEQEPRNQLAIVVGGKVAAAPRVVEPITGGTVQITANFSRTEAQRYVDLFRG